MRTIYLVRHGESEGNAGPTYQNDNTVLTEKGRQQAAFVAERTKKLPIEALIASTMVRAQQTAEIIASEVGLSIESSDLFVERRRPSEQIDQMKDDLAVIAAEAGIIASGSAPGMRYSDEENFDDLKARSRLALTLLENHPKDTLLVVSHGVFLRNLMAQAIFGDALTGPECGAILDTFTASNTGLSVLRYDPTKTKPWSILTWNDHAHLG